MKNVERKNRGWQKGHFWSNFHDYSTTMESFSNSPLADTRHSPRTQISGKPAVVLILAYWEGINYSDIKSPPLDRTQNALHIETITAVCSESPQTGQILPDKQALEDLRTWCLYMALFICIHCASCRLCPVFLFYVKVQDKFLFYMFDKSKCKARPRFRVPSCFLLVRWSDGSLVIETTSENFGLRCFITESL